MDATIYLQDPTTGAVMEDPGDGTREDWVIHHVTAAIDSTRSWEFTGDGVTLGEALEWEETEAADYVIDALIVHAWNVGTTSLREFMDTAEDVQGALMGSWADGYGTPEQFVADWLDDIYDVSELPEWAQLHAGALFASMARDLFIGGDCWEAYGYVFSSR